MRPGTSLDLLVVERKISRCMGSNVNIIVAEYPADEDGSIKEGVGRYALSSPPFCMVGPSSAVPSRSETP